MGYHTRAFGLKRSFGCGRWCGVGELTRTSASSFLCVWNLVPAEQGSGICCWGSRSAWISWSATATCSFEETLIWANGVLIDTEANACAQRTAWIFQETLAEFSGSHLAPAFWRLSRYLSCAWVCRYLRYAACDGRRTNAKATNFPVTKVLLTTAFLAFLLLKLKKITQFRTTYSSSSFGFSLRANHVLRICWFTNNDGSLWEKLSNHRTLIIDATCQIWGMQTRLHVAVVFEYCSKYLLLCSADCFSWMLWKHEQRSAIALCRTVQCSVLRNRNSRRSWSEKWWIFATANFGARRERLHGIQHSGETRWTQGWCFHCQSRQLVLGQRHQDCASRQTHPLWQKQSSGRAMQRFHELHQRQTFRLCHWF